MAPSSENGSLEKEDVEKSHIDMVDEAKVRRAVLRMDLTLLPIMTMFYLLSFLDRANIGNARVAGLQKSLEMTDRQYQIAVTITYVPYILAEVPANLVLRKVGANYLMPTILVIWGVIVISQGFVTSFHGLAAARAFLGLLEGPMLPGIILYLSGFYTRAELSLRIALFFSAASLSGAFSGLLAAAIENMHGVQGKPAWAWIFILEGTFTSAFGLVSFFLVPATPKDLKFLSSEDKQIIIQRLEQDRPFVNPLDVFSLSQMLSALRSPQVLNVVVVYFMIGTNLFGLALFLPSIVRELGYSPNRTQLLSVGPFAVGFFVSLVFAYVSDKYRTRAKPLFLVLLFAVVGYSMYLGTTNKHVSYAALFLMVPGAYAPVPIIAAWLSNNSEPYYRRATGIAVGLMAASCGGILSTWRYPTKEGPKFRTTTILNLSLYVANAVYIPQTVTIRLSASILSSSVVIMALTIINAAVLMYLNKQKELRRSELLAPYSTAEEPDGGLRAWVALGDRHPDFHYVI